MLLGDGLIWGGSWFYLLGGWLWPFDDEMGDGSGESHIPITFGWWIGLIECSGTSCIPLLPVFV